MVLSIEQIEQHFVAAESLLAGGYVLESIQILDGLLTETFPLPLIPQELRCRIRLGEILLEYTVSYDHTRRVLEGASRLFSQEGVTAVSQAQVLRLLGHMYIRKSQCGSALKYFEEALLIVKKKDVEFYSALCVEHGAVRLMMGAEGKAVGTKLPQEGYQMDPMAYLAALNYWRHHGGEGGKPPALPIEMTQRGGCSNVLRFLDAIIHQTNTEVNSTDIFWPPYWSPKAAHILKGLRVDATSAHQEDAVKAVEERIYSLASLRRTQHKVLGEAHLSELGFLIASKFILFSRKAKSLINSMKFVDALDAIVGLCKLVKVYPQYLSHYVSSLHILIATFALAIGKNAICENHLDEVSSGNSSEAGTARILKSCLKFIPISDAVLSTTVEGKIVNAISSVVFRESSSLINIQGVLNDIAPQGGQQSSSIQSLWITLLRYQAVAALENNDIDLAIQSYKNAVHKCITTEDTLQLHPLYSWGIVHIPPDTPESVRLREEAVKGQQELKTKYSMSIAALLEQQTLDAVLGWVGPTKRGRE